MKKIISFPIIKAFPLLFTCALISYLASTCLSVTEPIWWIFGLMFISHFLFFIRRICLKKIWRILALSLLWIIYLSSALVLFLYIIVIPYNYYAAWLALVQVGRPGGIISFIFFVALSWFNSLLTGLAQKNPSLPSMSALLLVILFELTVIKQDLFTTVLFVLTGIVLCFSLHLRQIKFSLKAGLYSLSVLFICLVLAFILASGSKPGSGILTQASLDANLKKWLVDLFPETSSYASAAGIGLSLNEKRLADKPSFSETPLFYIKTDKQKIVYLRTEVFDIFFENGWSQSPTLKAEALQPAGALFTREPPDQASVEITVLFDYLTQVPHLLSVRSIYLSAFQFSKLKTGTLNTGFNLDLPLLKNDQILITTSSFTDLTPSTEEAELFKMAKLALGQEPLIQEQSSQEPPSPQYLEVPTAVSERVRKLARDLSLNQKPIKILFNIYNYLKANCTYSLKEISSSYAFEMLDSFLFKSQKGYSLHFATAFIILARLNHIPARLVKGYFIYIPNLKEGASLKGLNAHLWPEVWLEGLGWTSVEATPALTFLGREDEEYERLFNSQDDEMTAKQLKALRGEVLKPAVEKTPTIFSLELFLPYLPWLLIPGIIALFIFLSLRFKKYLPKANLPWKGKLLQIFSLLRHLILYTDREGLPSPEIIGWLCWAKNLSKHMPCKKLLPFTIAGLIQEILFNQRAVNKRDVRFFKLVYQYYRKQFKG